MTDETKWEPVGTLENNTNSWCVNTYRIPVPGGWIYRVERFYMTGRYERSNFVLSTSFVPDPLKEVEN